MSGGDPASAGTLERRRLGRTSLVVPRLSLGCVTFGREIDESASLRVLDHAVDAGLTLLDTAEAYGGGQARAARARVQGYEDTRVAGGEFHSSELILGRWLAARPSRREKVVLQTKVAPPLSRVRILDSLDASLRRLRTDHLDAFLLHAYDASTALAESLGALGDAVAAGKVRHIGCSNFGATQVAEALRLADVDGAPRLEIAQFNYNLAVRDAETATFAVCKDAGVGTQTYSPLGAGFLTGKYDPATRTAPPGSRFDIVPGHMGVYFHPEKFEVVRWLRALSDRVGMPVEQIALAWVLANPAVDTVLVGARTPAHIDSAIAAMGVRFLLEWNEALGVGDP